MWCSTLGCIVTLTLSCSRSHAPPRRSRWRPRTGLVFSIPARSRLSARVISTPCGRGCATSAMWRDRTSRWCTGGRRGGRSVFLTSPQSSSACLWTSWWPSRRQRCARPETRPPRSPLWRTTWRPIPWRAGASRAWRVRVGTSPGCSSISRTSLANGS